MVEELYGKLMIVLDKQAPEKFRKFHRKERPCPWLTTELQDLCRQQNHLHRRLEKSPADANLVQQHRTARATARQCERKLKNEYFLKQLDSATGNGNAGQQWRLINTVTGRVRTQTNIPVPVSELSAVFSHTVTDIARPEQLSTIIPSGPSSESAFTEIFPCSPAKVEQLLRALDASKATGHDGAPPLVLKTCASVLSIPLAVIFNTSFKQTRVLLLFKKANVSPQPKGGDPSDAKNYHPVSLLPCVSRILEKLVQQQLTAFFEKEQVLPITQFAYRARHSTDNLLTLAVNRWLQSEYERRTTGAIFVDMSKAFDRVRHCGLLSTCQRGVKE